MTNTKRVRPLQKRSKSLGYQASIFHEYTADSFESLEMPRDIYC